MQIPSTAPTKNITVGKNSFSIPLPYTSEMFKNVPEGLGTHDVLAKKSNQTLAEDLTNNWRARCKQAETKKEPTPTQADLDKYIKEYLPGVRAAAGPSVDPVEKEAFSLAKAELKRELKTKKDLKVAKKGAAAVEGEISFEKFESLAAKLVEKYPAYTKKAQKNVAAREAAKNEKIAEFDL